MVAALRAPREKGEPWGLRSYRARTAKRRQFDSPAGQLRLAGVADAAAVEVLKYGAAVDAQAHGPTGATIHDGQQPSPGLRSSIGVHIHQVAGLREPVERALLGDGDRTVVDVDAVEIDVRVQGEPYRPAGSLGNHGSGGVGRNDREADQIGVAFNRQDPLLESQGSEGNRARGSTVAVSSQALPSGHRRATGGSYRP
jgi:hypothetical protein